MKAATVVAVALAAVSSFPLFAQQQPSMPSQAPAPQQQAQPNAGPSQSSSAAAAQLQPVSGELMNKLDTKSAKQGDSVELRTNQTVKITNGTEIPKGSRLVGHVTHVLPTGGERENSQIAIQFDRAELKTGQTLPIESVIQSVSPSTGESAMENNGGAAPMGSAAGSGSMSGSASASGGGSSAGSTSTPGQSTASSQPGMGTTGNASGTGQQSTDSGIPAPGSIVARNGNVAIRTTAIPGVLLANDINGLPFSNASGLLLGARRDVQLEGGTRMVLAVAMAPQGPGSGMSR